MSPVEIGLQRVK